MSKNNQRQAPRPAPQIPSPPAVVKPQPTKPMTGTTSTRPVPTLKELQNAILAILERPEYKLATCREVCVQIPRATHLVLDAETIEPLTDSKFEIVLIKREFTSQNGNVHSRWCYQGFVDCSELIMPATVNRMIARDLSGL